MVLLESGTRNKVYQEGQGGQREHLLVPSRSGRRLVVVELQEGEAGIEAYELSGYLTPGAAERRLQELAGCWLDEASRARMQAGEVLKVGELAWQSDG